MLTRRRFLSFLGAGIATAATPATVEPVRRIWQVGVQLERPTAHDLASLNIALETYRLWAEPPPTPATFMAHVQARMAVHGDAYAARLRDIAAQHPDDRAYLRVDGEYREITLAEHPSGTLFGIEASSYPEWKAARYTQTDAARLFRELTLSYANPETAPRGGPTRS